MRMAIAMLMALTASQPATAAAQGLGPRKTAPRRPPPLVVQVHGPASVRAGQTLDLEVAIERLWFSPAPLRLRVELPRGVRSLEGARVEEIVDSSHPRIHRRLRLRLEAVPLEDLRVVVDQRTDVFGVHATGEYRFGRPAPVLVEPPRSPRASFGGRPARLVVLQGSPEERR